MVQSVFSTLSSSDVDIVKSESQSLNFFIEGRGAARYFAVFGKLQNCCHSLISEDCFSWKSDKQTGPFYYDCRAVVSVHGHFAITSLNVCNFFFPSLFLKMWTRLLLFLHECNSQSPYFFFGVVWNMNMFFRRHLFRKCGGVFFSSSSSVFWI